MNKINFSHTEILLSGLKQCIEKQNVENTKLHKKVDSLQMTNELLLETNIKLSKKIELIEKEFRLRCGK